MRSPYGERIARPQAVQFSRLAATLGSSALAVASAPARSPVRDQGHVGSDEHEVSAPSWGRGRSMPGRCRRPSR
eukprot:1323467-Alexandrium_andersonii.AAC.1